MDESNSDDPSNNDSEAPPAAQLTPTMSACDGTATNSNDGSSPTPISLLNPASSAHRRPSTMRMYQLLWRQLVKIERRTSLLLLMISTVLLLLALLFFFTGCSTITTRNDEGRTAAAAFSSFNRGLLLSSDYYYKEATRQVSDVLVQMQGEEEGWTEEENDPPLFSSATLASDWTADAIQLQSLFSSDRSDELDGKTTTKLLLPAKLMLATNQEEEGDESEEEATATRRRRQLSKHHHHHRHNHTIDYTLYSCDAMPALQAKYPTRFNKCQFARTCNGGDGLIFPSLFCNQDGDQSQHNTMILIFLTLSLLLLFRLLNSTTDEFFSPGLELFSLQLGLPPRFAGVTLLALGNGAPDVAATMNAILGDARRGYQLALGELTGTCMFVTSVILGVIVSLSGSDAGEDGVVGDDRGNNSGGERDEEDGGSNVVEKGKQEKERNKLGGNVIGVGGGVPCRGPLLRDIAVLILVCAVSMSYLRMGVIDYGFVYTLLGMYGAYVLLVLGADAYHIFYHAPSMMLRRASSSSVISLNAMRDGENDDGELHIIEEECGLSMSESDQAAARLPLVHEQTPLVSYKTSSYARRNSDGQHHRSPHDHHHHHHHNTQHLYHHDSLPTHRHTLGDTVMEAMSNYSCTEDQPLPVRAHTHDNNINTSSEDITEFSPTDSSTTAAAAAVPPAAEGIFKKTSGWAPVQDDGTGRQYEPLVIFHPHHAVHPHHGSGGMLFLRSKSTGSTAPSPRHHSARSARQYSWSSQEDSSKMAQTRELKKSSSCDASSSTTPALPPAAPAEVTHGATKATMQIATPTTGSEVTEDNIDMFDERIALLDQSSDNKKPTNWKEAWSSNIEEFRDHWNDFFADIYQNKDNSVLDVILLSVE